MKRILVTGGNKGIGKAICERLLQEYPDTYVILGSRSVERGQEAVRDILNQLGSEKCKDRLECIELDTSSDQSVLAAAEKIKGAPLYGIVNNAGIGWGHTAEETVNTNYFGPRRVNDALGKLLKRPGGRIVNVASASGPNFVAKLLAGPVKEKLSKPWTIAGGITELDELAKELVKDSREVYGLSKSLLNAYTVLHAKMEKDLIINSCTPGWIDTDLTKGSGATNPPSKGAIPPCYLLMDEDITKQPTGRYYGSDCVRSPLDVYRDPGAPPYVSDEDLVELPETAFQR